MITFLSKKINYLIKADMSIIKILSDSYLPFYSNSPIKSLKNT